jgi:hypothetical protein
METNVHRGDCLREDCARVLGVAALLWGSVVAIAAFEGALGRFEGRTLAMLAVLVSLYATAVYFLDAGLRAYAEKARAMRARGLAAIFLAALAAALAGNSTAWALFLAPLATLASVAAGAHGLRRGATSASSAKSPGANPAAT